MTDHVKVGNQWIVYQTNHSKATEIKLYRTPMHNDSAYQVFIMVI